jgi:hypothetical protein
MEPSEESGGLPMEVDASEKGSVAWASVLSLEWQSEIKTTL